MKKLPEKIYATPNFDRRWQTKAIDDESVEYVRKDVFVEKAEEYLMEYEFNDSPTIADRRKRVEDFKEYMEKG